MRIWSSLSPSSWFHPWPLVVVVVERPPLRQHPPVLPIVNSTTNVRRVDVGPRWQDSDSNDDCCGARRRRRRPIDSLDSYHSLRKWTIEYVIDFVDPSHAMMRMMMMKSDGHHQYRQYHRHHYHSGFQQQHQQDCHHYPHYCS